MSSAVKPLTATSQNPAPTNQVTKTMHPQGTTASYNQPAHVPQSLNQQHHYSLNVPNTSGHYSNQNMGVIPVSNHPVANPSATAAGQGYSPQKNAANFTTNFQANLAHQQNANVFSQIGQTGTGGQQNAGTASQNAAPNVNTEKAHSNGTTDSKSPLKAENQDNFSITPKEKIVQPALVPQVQEKSALSKPADVPETKPVTPPSSLKTSPLSQPSEPPANASSPTTAPAENEKPSETTNQETEDSAKVPDNSTTEPENEDTTPPASEPENLTKASESSKDSTPESSQIQIGDAEEGKSNPEQESSPAKQIAAPAANITTPTKLARNTKSLAKFEETTKAAKEPKTPTQKSPSSNKAKRQRIRTQPYQSPLPEVELISKISTSTPRSNDEKLIVFYRNEFLAVRNAEGSFYLCQAVQNIYKSSSKIKIRWLSLDKNDKSGEIYTPDFYDLTDFDCILTNLSLSRVDKGKFRLPASEKERTQSILNRSLAVEKGEVTSPSLTEEHPDGLDLSLYRDEDQLKKRSSRKRKASQKRAKPVAKKEPATKKSPEVAKVKKVVETAKPTKKAPAAKRNAPSRASPEEPKKSTSSRSTSRSKAKTTPKTSSVVDQKKAKVLAKIGRKAAVVKPAAATIKNAKANAKPVAAAPAASASKKSPSKAPAKPQPRNTKRSTRK